MKISFLPVSDHRFKKSPFFECNNREDTLYGLYNNRLYPIDSSYDEIEHYKHMRSKCCLYDVPETPLKIVGKDSVNFLNKLFTRDISKLEIGKAGYAIACNHQGGVVMDGVLMKPNQDEFIYVQANGDFLNWAEAHIEDFDVSISDFDSWVLQIQGPTSLDVLQAVTGIKTKDFPYYAVRETEINGTSFYISRSGWTGERGFEIYSKNANFDGVELWNYLLNKGKSAGLMASDVSSMHIRRIEAGILDYGTDIDKSLNPFELGLERLVHVDKDEFIGRDALIKTNERSVRLKGVICEDTPLIRGNKLVDSEGDLGFVSAGAWSPTLDKGIGLIRLEKSKPAGYQVKAITSSGIYDAEIVELPFYDAEKKLTK